MATVNVATWDEFLAALANAEATVIEITSDLNVLDNPPTSNIEIPRSLTINGNDHTIWNLSTGGTVNNWLIGYTANRTCHWNDTKFYNILRNENQTVFRGSTNSDDYHIKFVNCCFQGQGAVGMSYACDFDKCAIVWTAISTSNGNIFNNCNFDYCWIRVESKYVGQGAAWHYFGNLNTCYVEGKITNMSGTAGALGNYVNNSCINVESDVSWLKIPYQDDSNIVNVYNSDKMTQYSGETAIVVPVTDAQMKDAAYLQSVGFNIIA